MLRFSELTAREITDLFLTVQTVGTVLQSIYSAPSLTIAIQVKTCVYCAFRVMVLLRDDFSLVISTFFHTIFLFSITLQDGIEAGQTVQVYISYGYDSF